jgi:CheY-like chemotaxis protein
MAETNGSRGRVLLVGLGLDVVARLTGILEGARYEVTSVPDPSAALDLATTGQHHAVVAGYPLENVATQGFLSILRKPSSASRACAFVFIAPAQLRSSAEAFVGWGANRVVTSEDAPRALAGLLAGLIQVAPRFPVRATSRVEVSHRSLTSRILCQTENISSTGMLLRIPKGYPPGTEMRFELQLRNDLPPIRGRGRVVRHTVERHERHTGIGVAFSELYDDGVIRLLDQLPRVVA